VKFDSKTSNDEWYYVDRYGTSKGPCTVDEITASYLQREVYDQTYIWNGVDIIQWTPLYQVLPVYTYIQNKVKNHDKGDNSTTALLEHTHSMPKQKPKKKAQEKIERSDTVSEKRLGHGKLYQRKKKMPEKELKL